MATKKKRTIKAKKSATPKTPAERDALLAFIVEELAVPNNINVDIDFTNPNGLDKELNEAILKHKIKRDSVGRPTSMTVPTLQKLKIALLVDCTVAEACRFAGIGESTFYDFQKKYPVFSELKDKWKETYVMAARLNIFKKIVGDKSTDDSWKILKAKRRNEYADKHIVEVENMVSTDDLEAIARGDYEAIED